MVTCLVVEKQHSHSVIAKFFANTAVSLRSHGFLGQWTASPLPGPSLRTLPMGSFVPIQPH